MLDDTSLWLLCGGAKDPCLPLNELPHTNGNDAVIFQSNFSMQNNHLTIK